jgi:hypothetical protein
MTSSDHDQGDRLSLTEQPAQVAVGCDDEEGCLIFSNDRLVAVLVRLLRIPAQSGQVFRFEAGQHSGMKPDTVPINYRTLSPL